MMNKDRETDKQIRKAEGKRYELLRDDPPPIPPMPPLPHAHQGGRSVPSVARGCNISLGAAVTHTRSRGRRWAASRPPPPADVRHATHRSPSSLASYPSIFSFHDSINPRHFPSFENRRSGGRIEIGFETSVH